MFHLYPLEYLYPYSPNKQSTAAAAIRITPGTGSSFSAMADVQTHSDISFTEIKIDQVNQILFNNQ